MSASIKKRVYQLHKNELLRLAKLKNINIPKKYTTIMLKRLLSMNVSKRDVDSIVGKPLKAKNKKGKGYERLKKGKILEDKVYKLFKRRGFDCKQNVKLKGAEIDIVGVKKRGGWLEADEWIVVECKNKAKVIPLDLKTFLANFEVFRRKEKIEERNITGYLYTTGLFEKDVKSLAKQFHNIKLKRLQLARI